MKPLSRDARSLIDAARDHEGMPDADRARLRKAVMTRAAAAGAALTAVAATTEVAAGATKLGAAKLWLALAITAGGAGTVVAIQATADAPATSVAAATSVQATTRALGPRVASGVRADEPARAAVPAVDAPRDSDAVATPAETPPPVPASAAPATSADALEDEARLLSRAQVAFGQGNAEAALDLLYQHEARYPRGKLSTERRALLAIVLCQKGRIDEGRRAAGALLDRATPLGSRIADACAGK